MDEIYRYGLTLVVSVFTRIIKWCRKMLFYLLMTSEEALLFIDVITSYISFAENALEGTSTYLQILFANTLDNYPGRFKLVVCSTISYIFGALVLLLFQETDRNTNTDIRSFCWKLLLIIVITALTEVSLNPSLVGMAERLERWIHFWPVFAFYLVAVGIYFSFDLLRSDAKFCYRNDPMCSAIFEVVFVIQIAVLKRYIVVATTARKRRLNSLESSTCIANRISWLSGQTRIPLRLKRKIGQATLALLHK
ncbi:uncharacterized protein LOC111375570 isoform X2 [Olea europaea var. sylvestris]|uniref:uncharacterized protein LOC111375570 isoform X2 n=1 Tax=Olea europaea var. sylvestris TaxID=158386 RepID=UPI000C1D31C7|nr:uncharacterized protein LOC111375570 isoform X2 [Olea europaea var. sylvestris]